MFTMIGKLIMLPNTYRKLTDQQYKELWAVYEQLNLFVNLVMSDSSNKKSYLQKMVDDLHCTLMGLNTLTINEEAEK